MNGPNAKGTGSGGRQSLQNDEALRVYIRLDFKGSRQKRFLRRTQPSEVVVDALRQEHTLWLKSFPLQGVTIEEIDASEDIYFFDPDKKKKQEVACAPLSVVLQVRALENLLPLILRPECTCIEILSPAQISLPAKELERFLYGVYRAYEQEVSLARETFH